MVNILTCVTLGSMWDLNVTDAGYLSAIMQLV